MVPEGLIQKKIYLTQGEADELAQVCKTRGDKISTFVRDSLRQRMSGLSTLDEIKSAKLELDRTRVEFSDEINAYRIQMLEDSRQQRASLQSVLDTFQEFALSSAKSNAEQISALRHWSEDTITQLTEEQRAKFKEIADLNIKAIQLIGEQINGDRPTSATASPHKEKPNKSNPRGNWDVFRNQTKE